MRTSRKRIAIRIGAAAALAVCFHLAWAACAAQPTPSPTATAAGEGVLVLRNGHLLQGRISRIGERYRVQVEGGEIWVSLGEIDLYCETLQDAFQNKKNQMGFGDANAHVNLAQWCQRHGLLEHAAEELAAARSLNPNHPMIPLVERRVVLSTSRPPAAPAPVRSAHRPASVNELDQVTRGMPPGTVDAFTQRIQPLLTHSCSTSQCHEPQSRQGLELTRLSAGGLPNRRTTQRNLLSVLHCIDRDNPAESPLLQAPLRAHGTARTPIFTNRSLAQYRQIVDWVHQVAQAPAPTKPLPGRSSPTPEQVQPEAPPSRAAPVDPFDPECFNRQFLLPATPPAAPLAENPPSGFPP